MFDWYFEVLHTSKGHKSGEIRLIFPSSLSGCFSIGRQSYFLLYTIDFFALNNT